MKRTLLVLLFAAATVVAAQAQFQFRAAGNVLNPIEVMPVGTAEWVVAIHSPQDALSGWHWEVVISRIGFGMHYAVDLSESETTSSAMLDWKGDFFFSYHPLGAGSIFDPFLEFGWGNTGTTAVSNRYDAEYPDWKDAAASDETVALSLYSYAAAGLALDLQGLLVGVRAAYMPRSLQNGLPGSGLPAARLEEFELGLFAGIALGAH